MLYNPICTIHDHGQGVYPSATELMFCERGHVQHVYGVRSKVVHKHVCTRCRLPGFPHWGGPCFLSHKPNDEPSPQPTVERGR